MAYDTRHVVFPWSDNFSSSAWEALVGVVGAARRRRHSGCHHVIRAHDHSLKWLDTIPGNTLVTVSVCKGPDQTLHCPRRWYGRATWRTPLWGPEMTRRTWLRWIPRVRSGARTDSDGRIFGWTHSRTQLILGCTYEPKFYTKLRGKFTWYFSPDFDLGPGHCMRPSIEIHVWG